MIVGTNILVVGKLKEALFFLNQYQQFCIINQCDSFLLFLEIVNTILSLFSHI